MTRFLDRIAFPCLALAIALFAGQIVGVWRLL